MRVVLQRVSRASVAVGGQVTGRIGRGYLLLAGFGRDDDGEVLAWMADKVISLRLFPDEQGRMNLGLEDVGGGILVVSQFTLYGDTAKGRRTSWIAAARPEAAEPLVERVVERLRVSGATVEVGRFRTDMRIELVNDGPVTLMLDVD
jgi:D-aminoacyl-tRNA deacylase